MVWKHVIESSFRYAYDMEQAIAYRREPTEVAVGFAFELAVVWTCFKVDTNFDRAVIGFLES